MATDSSSISYTCSFVLGPRDQNAAASVSARLRSSPSRRDIAIDASRTSMPRSGSPPSVRARARPPSTRARRGESPSGSAPAASSEQLDGAGVVDRRPPARLLEADRGTGEQLVVVERAGDDGRLAKGAQCLLGVARAVTRVAEAEQHVRPAGRVDEPELERGAEPAARPRRRRAR